MQIQESGLKNIHLKLSKKKLQVQNKFFLHKELSYTSFLKEKVIFR